MSRSINERNSEDSSTVAELFHDVMTCIWNESETLSSHYDSFNNAIHTARQLGARSLREETIEGKAYLVVSFRDGSNLRLGVEGGSIEDIHNILKDINNGK